MTTISVDVDSITRQAREVSFLRTLLTCIGAVLFSVGWVLHKAFALIWLAGAWCFVAAREGWREAGKARVNRATG